MKKNFNQKLKVLLIRQSPFNHAKKESAENSLQNASNRVKIGQRPGAGTKIRT